MAITAISRAKLQSDATALDRLVKWNARHLRVGCSQCWHLLPWFTEAVPDQKLYHHCAYLFLSWTYDQIGHHWTLGSAFGILGSTQLDLTQQSPRWSVYKHENNLTDFEFECKLMYDVHAKDWNHSFLPGITLFCQSSVLTAHKLFWIMRIRTDWLL